MTKGIRIASASVWAYVLVSAAMAQTPPPRSQFKTTVIANQLTDPTQIVFLPDGRLYLLNIKGNIQIIDPKTGQKMAGGTIPTSNVREDGLHSLVLDPQFATNRRVYALFGTQQPSSALVIARFTALASGMIDSSTRKDLLTVPVVMGSNEEHTTGCLAFGPDGNLYIGLGDNTRNIFSGTGAGFSPRDPQRPEYDAQRSAANTHDLRGKILRIRPEDDGTYTIPEGNLFARNTEKTRPEIYAMGLRHPFRITVDSKTGWLYWAEPGPNATQDNANQGPRGYEEVNLAKEPGNYGWPYCVGNNFCYTQFDYATATGGATYNPSSLVNGSKNNTGITTALPIARPALVWYPYNASGTAFPVFGTGSVNASMIGPVYRYDAANPSTTKLPPYFDGKLFQFDFSRSLVHTIEVDQDGKLVKVERFWDQTTSNPIQNPIDCKVGPDGALYFLGWGNGGSYPHNANTGTLVRLDYTGPVTAMPGWIKSRHHAGWNLLAPGEFWIPPERAVRASAFDPMGRRVWTWTPGSTGLWQHTDSRLLRVRVESH